MSDTTSGASATSALQLRSSELTVRRHGVHHWVLVEDFRFDGYTVPAGKVTDFASVPSWSEWITPRTGVCDEAAVIHDEHCRQLADGVCALTSRQVDALFRHMLYLDGMGARRWLYWWGVRLGALANPARRAGSWGTAPLVAAITLAVLVTVAAVLLGVGLVTAALVF